MGAELVERFLANGDTVIGTDVPSEALTTLEADLDAGRSLVTSSGNITDEDDVAGLAELASQQGGLDILVNCAGFFPFDMFPDTTLERWRTVIDVNLTGYLLVTHTLLPQMAGRGSADPPKTG